MSGRLYCTSCSTHFHEDDEEAKRSEWNPDARRTLHYIQCPGCGDDQALEDAYECEDCGEWFAGIFLDDGRCDECELKLSREEAAADDKRKERQEEREHYREM
jgi:DNA-directed RNA polymerase subunit RPC12/RpoP